MAAEGKLEADIAASEAHEWRRREYQLIALMGAFAALFFMWIMPSVLLALTSQIAMGTVYVLVTVTCNNLVVQASAGDAVLFNKLILYGFHAFNGCQLVCYWFAIVGYEALGPNIPFFICGILLIVFSVVLLVLSLSGITALPGKSR